MTDPGGIHPLSDSELASAYADGSLMGAARAAFEARLAVEPALREQVELEKRISDSLRRSFAVSQAAVATSVLNGAADDLAAVREQAELQERVDSTLRGVFTVPDQPAAAAARVPGAGGGSKGAARPFLTRPFGARNARWVAMAASLLMGVMVVAAVYIASRTGPEECPDEPFLELSTAYVTALEPGFVPQHGWNTPADFAEAIRVQFGVSLRMAPPPAWLHMVGWSTGGTSEDGALKPPGTDKPAGSHGRSAEHAASSAQGILSSDTMTLYAKSGAEPVIVLIDRLSADRDMPLARGSQLVKHRIELGGLVLYEVGVSEKAVLLDRFELR